jgi:hypothetical protein
MSSVRFVETQITYLNPGSFINRRFAAPGVEVNTGSYRPYHVMVSDARPIRDQFTLDSHGFVLAEHHSAVKDFYDNEEVGAVYQREIVEIVRRLTGADRVILQGWMVRNSGDLSKHHQRKVAGYSHQGGVQPPAGEAHVDFTPESAESRALDLFRKNFPGGKPYRRFMATSLWRAFSPPPQDWPLALCDGSSVSREEEATNVLVIVDEIPDREAMLAPLPNEKDLPTATIFRHSPKHRWWYFSNMTRDEVILLKFYDSDQSRAWRAPHTAFHDPSFPNARIRESIEVRSIAYFL